MFVLQLKAIGGGGFMRDVTKPDGMLGKCARRTRVWGSQGQRSGLGVITQASLNLGLQFLSHRRCHHLVVGAQLPAPPNARPPLFSLRSSTVSGVEGANRLFCPNIQGLLYLLF